MVKVLTGADGCARPKEEQFQVWLQNPLQVQTQDKAEKLSGRNKPLLRTSRSRLWTFIQENISWVVFPVPRPIREPLEYQDTSKH